ncbi:efflux RND transporter periplasmic adaptor subunit [Zhongshania aquimaris]|jgi:cobalt-zinc-cadmium efflux system membrane fusion protein|uniref:Efflux RND transporter periplasmic adaptor subunit n=2 Tax=Zhongshania TaxID=1434050 RepID=A0ABS6VX48_9GAMM|nr:efflux RND transporter periplasmic adaptor subunit [Zhongshania aquimaris]MBW2942921.1 efflux RND transporter periplasmic adaptor subunit [Zhongshania aquimaris]
MNIYDTIKTPIINAIFYATICFSVLVAHAESGHGDEEDHDEGHIELSQEQMKHAGIGLAQVGPGAIRETLAVYGVITSNAEQTQAVTARYDGVIRAVNKTIGDNVRKGDVLVTVEANESLKTYPIYSALNGVISQRNANIGEQTNDKTLFVVEDYSSVWVDLSVFPKDIAKLSLGQTVRIKSTNHASTGEGRIIFIATQGNPSNQATTARVLLNNVDNLWKPGLFVNAEITQTETAAATVINNEAVQLIEGETVIFVKGDEGFEPRNITLGRTDGEASEVLRGLKVGETYVIKNSFVLKSEMGKEDAEHGH